MATDKEQRSAFQFETIKLNILAHGAVGAFALADDSKWSSALLLLPFLSFSLFSLWLHHAFVILSASGGDGLSEGINKGWILAFKRGGSLSVAILSSFVGLPALSIVLFSSLQDPRSFIAWLVAGAILLLVSFSLYCIWLRRQYVGIKKSNKQQHPTA